MAYPATDIFERLMFAAINPTGTVRECRLSFIPMPLPDSLLSPFRLTHLLKWMCVLTNQVTGTQLKG